MHLPPQFAAKERSHTIRLMREHPFASLISNDDEGLPFATPLPLHLEQYASTGSAQEALAHWMDRLRMAAPSTPEGDAS